MAIELDAGGQRIGLIHAGVINNSCPLILCTLVANDKAWSAEVSIEEEEAIARA
ncbi:hypothetical protein ACJJIX_02040 [Microbulbifer sp. VAAC004]|uniref:hypothetical protein n=1 Tax=unclassified Microbulbifer TaxID=2619833 RepID=UPI004039D0ED